MFYYLINNNYVISMLDMETLKGFIPKSFSLERIEEQQLKEHSGKIHALFTAETGVSRRCYVVTSASQLFHYSDSLEALRKNTKSPYDFDPWLNNIIDQRKLTALNISYNNWYELLQHSCFYHSNSCLNRKWKINVVGLGDVGGILASGLRILGGDCIERIGLYDKDANKITRWYYECNQIFSSEVTSGFPEVVVIREDDLFDCDMFIFCVSVGVPQVGKEVQDVRLVQFNGNSKIVAHYAKIARNSGYKGIFSVVSDPVDLLCMSAFMESNKDSDGNLDFKGLSPDQIRGYGLGVMNARAAFYAKESFKIDNYNEEGRAFGPHGEGLVIANSIKSYDIELSKKLTLMTREANLKVRESGFKPYIAPALSSGSLSIIGTIKGQWHYSATFLNGAFFGCRNKLTSTGTELETHDFIPQSLFKQLEETHELVKNSYKSLIK